MPIFIFSSGFAKNCFFFWFVYIQLLKMVALLMFWFDFDDFCILLCSSLPCPVPHLIVWSGMLFFTLKSYILMLIPLFVLIWIWIQEWKLNWIFFSRVCQVITMLFFSFYKDSFIFLKFVSCIVWLHYITSIFCITFVIMDVDVP
jgi:hypothetical protein